MGRILLSIDGSSPVEYSTVASAKRAAKRAKSSAWIVEEIVGSTTITYETIWTWNAPKKR